MTIRLSLLAAATALFVLAGCKKADTTTPDTAGGADGAAAAQDTVRLQLNWFPEAEHGGYYQAVAEDTYGAAGLDVTVLAGGPKAPVLEQVAMGRLEFGIVNADKLLQARSKGMKLVALMAPFQKFPRCIIVHADSPYKTIADLNGATITANQTKPYYIFLQQKYDLSNLRAVPYEGGLTSFLNNKDFATQGYITSEPRALEAQGASVRTFMLHEEGFNPYASVLFTSERYLAEHPDVCRRMVEASQAGWVSYLADPVAGNTLIQGANEQMKKEPEVLAYGADHQRALMVTDEAAATNTFGTMTDHRWQELRDQLVQLKIIDPQIEPITAVFTTKFLKSQDDPAAAE